MSNESLVAITGFKTLSVGKGRAALVYNAKAKEFWGDRAYLNLVEEYHVGV